MVFSLIFLALVIYYIWDYRRRQERVEGITKKCVFITGCDSGFGHALAQRLDTMGVTVFAGCFTEKGSQELKAKTSEKLKTIIMNVALSADVKKAYDFCKDNIPRGKEFWAVVNNAGTNGPGGPMEFMTREDYVNVFQVNFFGPAEVSTVFLPLLKKSKGRIVNCVSIAGRIAATMNHPYVTSKYALEGYSDAIRREKTPWGIKVSAIEPGIYRTGLFDFEAWKNMKQKQWDNLPEETREEYGSDYMDKALEQRRHMINIGKTDLSPVIDAYEHALFSKYPRTNYPVGNDAKILSIVGMMPAFISDFVVKKFMKMAEPKALQSRS